MFTIKPIVRPQWGSIAFVLLAILLMAACASPAAPTAEPTQAPEPTKPAESTEAPVVEEEPAACVPEIRRATKAWKIGYGDGLAGIPFTQSVTDNINEVAKQMGVEIV